MSDGSPLWGGRFSGAPAPVAAALGRSIAFDRRLAPYDVAASIAHAEALRDAGLRTDADVDRLAGALREVGAQIAAGTFAFDPIDEDVHSAIERGVTDRLGDLGARLHAGRSRNDLVMTDLRLWLLDVGTATAAATDDLAGALVERAREQTATVMPGTTHLRAAQPVTLGHHLCAHAWALARDLERLAQWAERASACPLGAGALATSTLGLDVATTAERLLRPAVRELAGCRERPRRGAGVLASRRSSRPTAPVAADGAVDGSSAQVGWTEATRPGRAYKRNPDTAELARAKVARSGGVLRDVVLHGLPLGYHRDLRRTGAGVRRVTRSPSRCRRSRGAHGPVRPGGDAESVRRRGLAATDLVEALVLDGVRSEAIAGSGRCCASSPPRTALRDLDEDGWRTVGLPGCGDARP